MEGERDTSLVPKIVACPGSNLTSTPAHTALHGIGQGLETDSGYATATPSSLETPPCKSDIPLPSHGFTPIPTIPPHGDWESPVEQSLDGKYLDESYKDSPLEDSTDGDFKADDRPQTEANSPSRQSVVPIVPVNLVTRFPEKEEKAVVSVPRLVKDRCPKEAQDAASSVSPSRKSTSAPSSFHPPKRLRETFEALPSVVADRVIGRRVGISRLDIIKCLDDLKIPVMRLILWYLDPKDVCSFSCVSKIWNRVCGEDREALAKREVYREQVRQALEGKENSSKAVTPVLREMTFSGQVMGNVQRAESTPTSWPSTSDPSSCTSSFEQAASSLSEDESLQHCPKCFLASKILATQHKALCLSAQCGYEYCVKCFNVFHEDKPCPSLRGKPKPGVLLTKKSKKNLKRL